MSPQILQVARTCPATAVLILEFPSERYALRPEILLPTRDAVNLFRSAKMGRLMEAAPSVPLEGQRTGLPRYWRLLD